MAGGRWVCFLAPWWVLTYLALDVFLVFLLVLLRCLYRRRFSLLASASVDLRGPCSGFRSLLLESMDTWDIGRIGEVEGELEGRCGRSCWGVYVGRDLESLGAGGGGRLPCRRSARVCRLVKDVGSGEGGCDGGVEEGWLPIVEDGGVVLGWSVGWGVQERMGGQTVLVLIVRDARLEIPGEKEKRREEIDHGAGAPLAGVRVTTSEYNEINRCKGGSVRCMRWNNADIDVANGGAHICCSSCHVEGGELHSASFP